MRNIYPGKHIDQWPFQSSRVRNWLIETVQMAGGLPELLAWTLWINVICKRPDKAVLPIKKIKNAKKKKKVMIVAPQLYFAELFFTAYYAAFIDPPSCFFFSFPSVR